MRLLNTSTVQLHEFFGSNIPKYAILSHRWEDGEISFKDVTKSRNLEAAGWSKVGKSCEFAKSRGHDWIWVDTCCIDKRSSAELSEAINSMFNWYLNSEECYAFLNDVPSCADREALERALSNSEWFKRGWTLQELLAPANIIFLDQNWTPFGTKESIRGFLSSLTGIAEGIMGNKMPDKVRDWNLPFSVSIATRMSWASRRVCTRDEDVAYCLLGIFGINMPLLYGEGGEGAFRRLQLEIMKSSDDESIFAWYRNGDLSSDEEVLLSQYQREGRSWITQQKMALFQRGRRILAGWELLAPSPAYFYRSKGIRCRANSFKRLPYSVTNKGLQFSIEKRYLDKHYEVDKLWPKSRFYEIPLNCVDIERSTQFCLHICNRRGPQFKFDESGLYSRYHPSYGSDVPEAIFTSRSSITEALFKHPWKLDTTTYDHQNFDPLQVFYIFT